MRDKIKALSKQTLIYGTSTIVGRFLNFLLVPFYTNVFPPSEYGINTLIFAYIALMNVIFSLGFESGYFKFASTLEVGTPKENFSHPFFTILLNSALLSTIILILAPQITSLISLNEKYVNFVYYSAFILFFDAIAWVPFASLRLHNKAVRFTVIKITNIVINVALNFILVLVFKMGLVAVFISNLAASIVTFLLLSPEIFKNLAFTFNKKLFNELWRFSLPYVPAGLTAIMVQVVSRPIMQFLTDEASVGIFQANYRLGVVMMLVCQMFEYAWRPFFLNNAREPNAKQIFSKVLTVFVGFASVVFVVLTFFTDNIVRLPIGHGRHIIGPQYWEGIYIVPIILFAYLFNGIYINFMAGIYIEKKTKYLPAITGLGAGINIVFNLLLIPKFGLYGAAIATFVSYLAMAIYIYKVSQKFYPVSYDLKRVYALILLNVAVLAIFFLMFYHIIPSELVLIIIISVGFIFVIAYLSDLLKARKIFSKSTAANPE